MNKKTLNSSRIIQKNSNRFNFAVMIIFLLCGAVAGCIFALYGYTSIDSIFFRDDVISIMESGSYAYSFWSAFLNLTKYPLIIFLLSFTAFGYLVIPLVVFLKSFFLTVSISTVLRLYGVESFFLPMSIFGIQSALSIPTVLLIATFGVQISKCFSFSFRRGKGSQTPDEKMLLRYILVFISMLLFLLLFTFLDIAITPILVSLFLK